MTTAMMPRLRSRGAGRTARPAGRRATGRIFLYALGCCAASLWGAGSASWAADAAKLEFNRDIRPILYDKCFSCHGPDSASRQGDLRLDRRDEAVDRGAIAAGDPDASEMVRRILSNDEFEVMPPPEIKKPLTDEERATLIRWIQEGAEYQPHWSLIAPQRPTAPPVADEQWVRNPIDRFVAAQHEALGMQPAPEADLRTLARRASLDLTGLPPSPEEIEELLVDPAPDAYERYVDRLLASPRWGEHRARYWLDYARYADTHGLHFDNYREMWSYRDWLINAFNQNMPFDQFTIESLAGDLLPNPTLDQLIGSGFNRCNITTNEGGVIEEEYAVLYTRDRTETASVVWMGLTSGCAVCHDHKFDELTQREFYELSAFFNNTTQRVFDGNIKDTPPVVKVPPLAERGRWDALPAEIAAANAEVQGLSDAGRADFAGWLAGDAEAAVAAAVPSDALHLHAPLADGAHEGDAQHSDPREIAYQLDGAAHQAPLAESAGWNEGKGAARALHVRGTAAAELPAAGDLESDQPFTCAAWIRLGDNSQGGTIVGRMDEAHDFRGWDFKIDNRRLVSHLIHRWPDNAVKIVADQPLPAGAWVHVALAYDGSRSASGLRLYVDGVAQAARPEVDSLRDGMRTDVPLKIGQRHASGPLDDATLEDLRIYRRTLTPAEIAALAAPARLAAVRRAPPEAESVAADREALHRWRLEHGNPAYQEASARLAALQDEQRAIEARSTVGYVMQERNDPAIAYILNRGEYDQRRDEVSPDTPDVLPPFPTDLPRNRLGLAQWLLRDDHPLTARVFVNRAWYEVFGRGIVESIGDLGVSGAFPTQPELLDWLAVEFRESGWDVKQLYKLMLCSATYRQSAAVTPDKLQRDPDNRYLTRGPRFRMDAEMVRDYALAASGLMVRQIGGPSVKPYQPPGVWEAVAMPESNTKQYQEDAGDALYRRSLYTFWKRSAPPALLEVFNAPNREHCLVMRERTNTPLQALATLNGVQFVEAARVLACDAMREAGSEPADRVQWLAERLLARSLTDAEVQVALDSFAQLQAQFAADEDAARQLITYGFAPVDLTLPAAEAAAWTVVANQLLNLDECLNK